MNKLPPKQTCMQNLVRIDDREAPKFLLQIHTLGGVKRSQKNFHRDWKKKKLLPYSNIYVLPNSGHIKNYKHQYF